MEAENDNVSSMHTTEAEVDSFSLYNNVYLDDKNCSKDYLNQSKFFKAQVK